MTAAQNAHSSSYAATGMSRQTWSTMLAVPSSWTSGAGRAPAAWVTKQNGKPPGERITT